ncbi:MAG: hypothetical protein HY270_15320 [Deltaproteobacteria bacterium]|nr:hypothetical protein [Deltaproteobacteria bacterium]
MSGLRATFERLVGNGVFLGTTAAFLSLLAYSAALQWGRNWISIPERILLEVLGSGPRVLVGTFDFFVVHHGYVWLLVTAVLLAWRRTRPITVGLVDTLLVIIPAWLSAMVCFFGYVMDHSWGALCFPLALLPAFYLWRCRRLPILSMILLACGLCLGLTIGVPMQHDVPEIVSPLHRFVPTALVSLLGSWLVALRTTPASSVSASRALRMWGLSVVCAASLVTVGVTTARLRPRGAPPERILNHWTYDLHLVGQPAELLWTDREQIHVLTNPYGEAHESYVIGAADLRYPQRIWESPTNGFYVQLLGGLGWWKSPAPGQRIAPLPAAELRHDLLHKGSPWAFAEDPATGNVFTVSEWKSHYVVMNRDTGAAGSSGDLSAAYWGVWHFTPDLRSRLIYVSSAMEDGGLYEWNLDSLALTQRASTLDVYETVLDSQHHVLWGARPLTGEVIGVDTSSYRVLYRIVTGFGARDLQRDPGSGALYTCSLYGDVFRVDATTQSAERIAWCGRLCRNLFLDPAHKTLWAATDDGICRIALRDPRLPAD